MKDKLMKMFKGKKKTENLVVILILLVVVVVAINYIWNNDDSKNESAQPNIKQPNLDDQIVQVSTEEDNSELEKRLANILSKISGVGKVKVMLTFSESSTLIPIYDENSKTSNTTESDKEGRNTNNFTNR